MISIESIVHVFLFLLGAGAVLGLLWYLATYCESQFPGVPLLWKAARIFLVIAAVLILIGLILELMGKPLIRFRSEAPIPQTVTVVRWQASR